MVSDGVKPDQIHAKHSLNGCWMADSFQTAAVLSALRQAVAWLNPRQASTSQASTSRAAGRHAAPARNRAPRNSPVLPRHAAAQLASPVRLEGRPAS
jgi:hypothetical protein